MARPDIAEIRKGAIAQSGAPTLLHETTDLDRALYRFDQVVPGGIVAYSRAIDRNDALPASFKDRMAGSIVPGAGGAIANDNANFGGKDTYDMTGMNTVGFPSSATLCPASFTFILPFRMNALRTNNSIFSVTESQFVAYINGLNKLVMDDKFGAGEASFSFANSLVINTTYLLWISHDAVSKTSRYGITNNVAESHVHTLGHAPGAASFARFASWYTSLANTTINGHVEGWALLSGAYAASGSDADDAIADVLTNWRDLLGL